MAAAALIFAGVQAAGQVMQGVQGYQAGKAAARESEAQAAAERRAGLVQERQSREQSARYRAAQLARLSKAGVTTQGTGMDVLEETAGAQERDALALRYNAQNRERAYTSQASIQKANANTALISGAGGAAKTGFQAYGIAQKSGTLLNQPYGKG